MRTKFLVLTMLGSLLLSACSKDGDKVTVSSINIKSETILFIGAEETLTATLFPKGATDKVTWASSDNSIATVDQTGTVTALNEGTTEIIASAAGVSSNKCIVTVRKKSTSVSSINIKTATTLFIGDTETLTATISPEDATETATWTSTDISIATVDQTGTVTALKAGTTEIIATAAGVSSNKCKVTVQKKINPEHIAFADEMFLKALLKNGIDTNDDGGISYTEALAVTDLNIAKNEIASLKGIEHFTNLETLNCTDNKLTNLNLEKNTALTEVDCSFNQLASLNVSELAKLSSLSCSNNRITKLDISTNTALNKLNCYFNLLNTLQVSTNTELTELICGMNSGMKTLDLTKNKALKKLYCGWNQMSSLDLSANTELTELSCEASKLTALDLRNQKSLTYLDCWGNYLTKLNVSENTALSFLDCSSNQLTTLNLSTNKALTSLDCSVNKLTMLDLTSNTGITYLLCSLNEPLKEIWVKAGTDTSKFQKDPEMTFIEK